MRTERLSAARYLRVSSCTFREDTRTPLREEALSFYQGLDRCDVNVDLLVHLVLISFLHNS